MKIEKIKVENFKGIDYLEFKPKMMNILIGRNNTCKTSILQAIDFTHNNYKFMVNNIEYPTKLINFNSKKTEIQMELSDEKKEKLLLKRPDEIILRKDINNKILLVLEQIMNDFLTSKKSDISKSKIKEKIKRISQELTKKEIISELIIDSVLVRYNTEENIYYLISSKKLRKILKPLFKDIGLEIPLGIFEVYFEEGLNNISLYNKENQKKIKFLEENSKVFYIGILNSYFEFIKDEKDKIKIQKIQEIIKKYDLVENLERFDWDAIVFNSKQGRKQIPYEFMGDGFKKMVELLAVFNLKNIENKVLLLEEPNSFMHPGYTRELIKLMLNLSKVMNVQLFITTHNFDLIEGFFNEESLSKKEVNYLKKELLILRTSKNKDIFVPKLIKYKDAVMESKEIFMDLRGL